MHCQFSKDITDWERGFSGRDKLVLKDLLGICVFSPLSRTHCFLSPGQIITFFDKSVQRGKKEEEEGEKKKEVLVGFLDFRNAEGSPELTLNVLYIKCKTEMDPFSLSSGPLTSNFLS